MRTVRMLMIWAALTGLGVVATLAFEAVFRTGERAVVVPFAQAFGLWVAWAVAWPLWFRDQPGHRAFLSHVTIMTAVLAVVVALRIKFTLG